MKIVYLNIWGGRMENQLLEFFKNNNDVDVFCLQEVYSAAHEKEKDPVWQDSASLDIYNEIIEVLPDYKSFYRPHLEDYWGLSIFVKNDLLLESEGEVMVHEAYSLEEAKKGKTSKNLQYITLGIEDQQRVTIINFHGLWNGQGKGDSDDRIKQSENIISFIKTLNHPFILGGDFNLNPDTKSLGMLEDCGLRNLIDQYGVTSTRTAYYQKENKFADYVFVSKGVQVEDFQVLPDEVSDHAPLCVKINA